MSCFDVFYHALAPLACEQSPKACLKTGPHPYSLDSPLRSKDFHGGSDFLASRWTRGHFLVLEGAFLRWVAAENVSH